MPKLLIDTDTGVDDALALAWLLTQHHHDVEILGITAVAGNTTVDNAANNILTLLHAVGREDIPLVVGAAKPFCRPLTQVNKLIHGPDGLWGAGTSPPFATSLLSHNCSRLYKEILDKHENVILLTLGPLTNIALAINQYPETIARFKQIVVLGGTQAKGSMTPVAEYNFWQDPEAANVVLSAHLPVTLMPREAFTPFTLTFDDLQTLQAGNSAVLDLLYPPLRRYISVQNQLGGSAAATLPDVVAAIYAVDPSLAVARPALVQIVTNEGPTRGQSVMAFTVQERVSMSLSDQEMADLADRILADPTFDLTAALQSLADKEPVNCQVITDIQLETIKTRFLQTMVAYDYSRSDIRSKPSFA